MTGFIRFFAAIGIVLATLLSSGITASANVNITETFDTSTFMGSLSVANNGVAPLVAFAVYNDTSVTTSSAGSTAGNWHSGIVDPGEWDAAIVALQATYPSLTPVDFETAFGVEEGLAMVYWVDSSIAPSGLDLSTFINEKIPLSFPDFTAGDASAVEILPGQTGSGFTFMAETGGSPFAAILTDGSVVTGETVVPIPGALGLLVSALAGLGLVSARKT